jgi:hypothetical protein
MFSGVRMKRCNVRVVRSYSDRPPAPVMLERTLHSSWINALKRGRRAVITRYLAQQCDRNAAAVELERDCDGVKGAASSHETYRFDCAAQQLSVRGP